MEVVAGSVSRQQEAAAVIPLQRDYRLGVSEEVSHHRGRLQPGVVQVDALLVPLLRGDQLHDVEHSDHSSVGCLPHCLHLAVVMRGAREDVTADLGDSTSELAADIDTPGRH